MRRHNGQRATSDDFADRLRQLRRAKGLSRAQLADSSGLSRRTIASLERGRASLPEGDLSALARACGVEAGELDPPGYNLTLTVGASSDGTISGLQGEAALDALLREYVSMVVELRESRQFLPASLRQDDLCELARALGGTPEAIEARLIELLGTDQHEAWQLRTTIVPSLGAASTSRLETE